MTVQSPEKEEPQVILNEQRPLLISENPSPYSDTEVVFYDNNDQSKEEQNQCIKDNLQRTDVVMNEDKQEQNIRPSSLPISQDDFEKSLKPSPATDFSNNKDVDELENDTNGELETKRGLRGKYLFFV